MDGDGDGCYKPARVSGLEGGKALAAGGALGHDPQHVEPDGLGEGPAGTESIIVHVSKQQAHNSRCRAAAAAAAAQYHQPQPCLLTQFRLVASRPGQTQMT